MQLTVNEINEDFIKKLATSLEFKSMWIIAQQVVEKVFNVNKQMLLSEKNQELDIRNELADFRKELAKKNFDLSFISNSDLYSKLIHPVYRFQLKRGL